MANAATSESTDGAADVSERRKGARRSSTKAAIEWVIILLAALLVAVLLHLFVVQAFYIPSGSMEPTLVPGDRVLVDKLSYDFHSVRRGDIVVFLKPSADTTPGIKDLIKRVIGLPGERIASGPDPGEVLINDKPIAQPWLTVSAKAAPGPNIRSQVLPRGEYFMMGDNRGDSADSRIIGPVADRLIVGRAFVRVWPFSHFGGL